MNEGDLVQLSAYGKKLKILSRFKNDVGIVLTSHGPSGWWPSGQVMWSSGCFLMNRRDIKKVKI